MGFQSAVAGMGSGSGRPEERQDPWSCLEETKAFPEAWLALGSRGARGGHGPAERRGLPWTGTRGVLFLLHSTLHQASVAQYIHNPCGQ